MNPDLKEKVNNAEILVIISNLKNKNKIGEIKGVSTKNG